MNSTALFVLASILLAGPQVPAEHAVPDSKMTESLAAMKDAASTYRFQAAAGEGATVLIPDPVLRWSNPVAQEDDAGLFLWTRQGCPEAAAQFFVRKNLWMHEFQSLAESPFAVDWSGQTVWAPNQAGLIFHVDPDSRPPDSDAIRRLRQMRKVAESFTASVEFQYDKDSHYELRLLPRQLYRFGSAEGKVLDGTLWAFVQGTNPEVLLLVESRPAPDHTLRWNYAFAAMTSYPAQARRDGKSVWKVDRQPIPTPDTRGPYLFRYDVPTADDKSKSR